MIYAILNSEKIDAEPGARAKCPLCERDVFAKCGEINTWHWSHLKGEGCDSWSEPETQWHKNWKLIFGREHSEVIIKKEGIRHIADVLTKNEVVIELQNSPIPKPIIRKRNNFYGERMIWIVNGYHFKESFYIHGFPKRYNPMENWNPNNEGVENVILTRNEIERINREYELKTIYTFTWNRPRKSWEDVERPVFIDFGGDNLFWVTHGMGTSSGKGKKIPKTNFIKKYEGDISSINNIILTNSALYNDFF